MIKIQNDREYDGIDVKDYYVNPNNIACICAKHDEDGYVIIICFIGERNLTLETENEDKFNEWLKLLGV